MICCEICHKEHKNILALSIHIKVHGITSKEYYDKYLKKNDNEGICKVCGKETAYLGLNKGYSPHCSTKCSGCSNEINAKRAKTNIERYGFANPRKNKEVINKIQSKNKERFYNKMFTGRLGTEVIPNFTLEEYTSVVDAAQFPFKCLKHDYIFHSYIDDGHIPECPKCHPYEFISDAETELAAFITDELEIDNVQLNTRKLLSKNKEIDIYIEEHKLAIEMNGMYWHGEHQGKDQNYHLNKTKECKDQGITLLHIFDHEWNLKKDIVKSIVRYKLKKCTDKYSANKMKIKRVNREDTESFLDSNHIQGNINNNLSYGLYFKDELMSILVIGKSRYDKKYDYELLRFCNKINTVVRGGFSKLFTYFINDMKPSSVITYADLRFGGGDVYKYNGFKFERSSKPNYYYFDKRRYTRENHSILYSRLSFQKHKLKDKLEKYDELLTEYENMFMNGYDRIYDCGNNVYIWSLV